MEICLCCGQLLPGDRVTAEQLAEACRRAGLRVTPDGRISEAAAADLLGLAPGTVRNWRSQHRPLAYVRIGGRVTYRLETLAALINAGSDED